MSAPPADETRVAAAYRIAERVVASLAESVVELREWTFDEDQLADLGSAGRKDLDAFLKRFENVVEAGRRLFRAALVQGQEEQRGLSAGEVAIRMEQLGVIDSADDWATIVSARNAAAHEYAADPEAAAEALPRAYAAAVAAIDTVTSALDRLRARFPPPASGHPPVGT